MSTSKTVVRILSIDGGGIRGIIPLHVLKYIEEKSNFKIHELFDVIGGTSTGGIIALGLNSAKPNADQKDIYSADDLFKIYTTEAGEIFQINTDSLNDKLLSWIRTYIISEIPILNRYVKKNGSGIITSEYSGQKIESFLKSKFGSDVSLSQLSTDCDVTVYSYDIENDQPYIFNKQRAAASDFDDYYVWQAARATSAAPSFFPALELPASASKIRFGIAQNSNPTVVIFQNNLYMTWRGASDGKDKIYYASFDGSKWSNQNRVGNFGIAENSSPAIASSLDKKLYMTWRGSGDGKDEIYYASFDGSNWSNQNQAGDFGIAENSSPAIVSVDEKLYMTWRGSGDGKDKIYYASFDGSKWSNQNRAGDFGIAENSSPTVTVQNNIIYMAWRGSGDGKNKIYYASFDGSKWSNQNRAGDFGIAENSSPAIVSVDEKLYMTWRGDSDGKNKIYYASFDGSKWSNQNQAGDFEINSSNSPALTTDQTKLYMAWLSSSDKGIGTIYYATYDGEDWSNQRSSPDFRTLVDGGIFINNPAIDLLLKAKEIYPEAEDFILVSLGTGDFFESEPQLKNSGFLTWLRPLISYMMRGVSDNVDNHLHQLFSQFFNSEKSYYYRLEPRFNGNIEMDAIEKKDIDRLNRIGQKFVDDNKLRIDEIVEKIKGGA
jgi:patatin-like phospholipase/acyl hydrolase